MKERRVQSLRANIEKIVDLGGYCDCEEISGPALFDESEWQHYLSDLLSPG